MQNKMIMALSFAAAALLSGCSKTQQHPEAAQQAAAADRQASTAYQQCLQTMQSFVSEKLNHQVDAEELTDVMVSLEAQDRLPEKFVTKKQARSAGWRPGTGMESVPALKGKAIGGDRFNNFEKRLPQGSWREADLNYQGGHRDAVRLVYQAHADPAYVTLDHYQHFQKVPSCQHP